MRRFLGRALISLAPVLWAAGARAGELAVIVNPANTVAQLSSGELREILLLERQHWRAADRIYLLLPESGTAEKELMLRRALRMTEDQLHRLYLGKLYGGEIPEFPRTVPSGASARRIVARAPNALAVVDSASVDGTVRVLRIDGRRPGEPDYPLSSAGR
jgi:hypothetical protein